MAEPGVRLRRPPATEAERRLQHPAANDVTSVLAKASQDLVAVQRQLETEFAQAYPDRLNPCKLVGRIKRVQEEVAALQSLCRDLLAEKQELIDMARTSLLGQRASIQRLLSSSGLPPMSVADEAAYTNLNEVIDEWTVQVAVKTGDDKDEDINKILFSAIVQSN